MNATETYFNDVFEKSLRYLIAKLLFVRSYSKEELYEEIDSYDPREFGFSMEQLISNGLDFDSYLEENFVVNDNKVSLTSRQEDILKQIENVAKISRFYEIKKDHNGFNKLLNLVKQQKVSATTLFILFDALINEASGRIDINSLFSMGSLFRFMLYKDKAIKKIQEVKFEALNECNYPIETFKELIVSLNNFDLDYKDLLELKTLKDLLNFKDEYIYLLLYPQLEYNLRTLIDLTGDIEDHILHRIDRFMDRYITSTFYEEYRSLYYKDHYELDYDNLKRDEFFSFINNALYCWLKDKHDYLIFAYIKQKLDVLGLKKGTISAMKLFKLLGGGLLAFEVLTYIITTDYLIHFDDLTDDLYYDIDHYEEISKY